MILYGNVKEIGFRLGQTEEEALFQSIFQGVDKIEKAKANGSNRTDQKMLKEAR